MELNELIKDINLEKLKMDIYENTTLENSKVIDFLELFRPYDGSLYGYFYSDLEISSCFFDIIGFNNNDLYTMLSIFHNIREKFSNDELSLCLDEVERGEYDIDWIINKNNLRVKIEKIFNNRKKIISHQINRKFNTDNFLVRHLREEKVNIDKEMAIKFLEALDFYEINNEDYFLILLFCMKISINNFELEKEPLLEYFIFFLSDKDRVDISDKEIAQIVVSYLCLMKRLRFFSFFHNKEQNCLDMWNERLKIFRSKL